MSEILFIDAAVRAESRTRRLAEHLLEKLDGEVTRLSLYETEIPRLDAEKLDRRTACCSAGDFSDPCFDLARQLIEADAIVIAAPYWDLSFPSVLKDYIEAISVNGITFTYSESGVPIGYCRAKKLYYVTTAGGPIVSDEPGFGYVSSLFRMMYGVKDAVCIKAEGLDIWGADVEGIMRDAMDRIDGLFA